MKVYHYNDPDWRLPNKEGDYHCAETRKYWGHIVTNKANRIDLKYAWLFDPEGQRAHQITRATFKMLASGCEHIYIETITEIELNAFINKIPALSKFQAHRFFKCFVSSSDYLEMVKSKEVMKSAGTIYHVLVKTGD